MDPFAYGRAKPSFRTLSAGDSPRKQAEDNHNYSGAQQIGVAGEYLVMFDLTMQGFVVHQACIGSPYDLIVDFNDRLIRLQVKSTLGLTEMPHSEPVYLFYTRRAEKRNSSTKLRVGGCDYYAFVALDAKEIAYVPSSSLISPKTGHYIGVVSLRSTRVRYAHAGGNYLQNYQRFIP